MEPRRIYDYRSPHCQPHCTAASNPGYRSLRAFLLVKRQGAMDHLRKPWPHETHARERSRNRRERSDVPHSARPMSLFRIGQSQAQALVNNFKKPGVEIRKLVDLIRDDVMKATDRHQLPFHYGSLPGDEDFFFRWK